MRFFKMDFSKEYDEFLQRYDITGRLDRACAVCGASYGIPEPPIALRIRGTPLPDIIIFSAHLIVKDGVKEAVEDADFTGVRLLQPEVQIATDVSEKGEWELYKTGDKESRLYYVPPTKVQTGTQLQGLPFWHIDVVGRARLHPENNCLPVQSCEACGHVIYSTWENGMRVDESRWDGSDFIRLEEHGGFVIVTEQVKSLFEARKFTGARYIPLSELVDEYAPFRPPRNG